MRLEHGGQSVGPAGGPAGGVGADGSGDQRRRHLGQGPQPGAIDGDEAVVADLLAGEQRTHDVDALAQTRVADVFARPAIAGDVLVGRLASAERDPEAPWVHRGERGSGLRDDRRVVTLPWRVDDPEGQSRPLQCGAQPRPRERRVTLPFAPRREVIRAHRGREADLLGELGCLQEPGRMNLLVRGMEAECRHPLALPALPAEESSADPYLCLWSPGHEAEPR